MMKQSEFKPAWWLSNNHLQTLWPSLFRRPLKLNVTRERFDLSDGDFVDLDWVGSGHGPIVVVLHGLGGSIESPYAQRILKCIADSGYRGVLMHFRGCSGEPNRLPRHYHSGETGDLAEVVQMLANRYPQTALAAIGYSLGGNVLLKWLGETRENNPLQAAVAVSVPFELHKAANQVNQGFSRLYQWLFLRDLRKYLERKAKVVPSPVDLNDLATFRNFFEFDNKITAPLHGFKDAMDYYNQCSSRSYLKYIQVPTLIIHADDDPLINRDLKVSDYELSDKVIFEVSQYGGHVGYIAGSIPFRPEYWLETRVSQYFKEVFI